MSNKICCARSLLLSISLMIFSCHVMADISLSKYAKVYKGREGMVVTLVPLMPKDSKKALIEVKGIDTELDGLILQYNFVNEGMREAYAMTYDGRSSTRLRTNQGYWGKWTSVYLPDVKGEFDVAYDDKASKAFDVDKFKARYLKQEEGHVQDKLATFRKEKHLQSNNVAFGEKAKAASDACGTSIQASIDWSSISDDNLKELSISSYCGEPLESLADLCKKSPDNKKTLSQKVSKFNCRMGNKLHLGISDKTLNWITAKDVPNQGDFTKYVLMNEL